MNSNNKYGLEYAGPRRVRRGGWMTVLTALTLLTLSALAGWLWSWVSLRSAQNEEWRMRNEEFVLRHSDFDISAKRAGFPDWVAFGAVGMVVAFMLARLAWDVCVKPDCGGNVETRAEQSKSMANEEVEAEPVWMRELMGLFARRGILLTRRNCEQMRALCAPDHPLALVMLDSYLRRELGTRLFVTSLMEIQSVCAKGLATMNGEGVAA
jgi:hypothetical protein